MSKEFKYDVSISLCKEDVDFARKLVQALNPSLNIFFYESQQQELISESGPEKFARIFKEESRIVVILSRKQWSETYYTEIERNAIIDRTSVKNEGFKFLIVIPMEQDAVPNWYPSTHIYANPQKFLIEQLARFVEFKIAEEGGRIREITVEDRYQSVLNRIEEKKSIVKLQESKLAVESAKEELNRVKTLFEEKRKFLLSDNNSLFHSSLQYTFNESEGFGRIGLNGYMLDCKLIQPERGSTKIHSTQSYAVLFSYCKTYDNYTAEQLIDKEIRYFYYNTQFKGWATQYLKDQATINDLSVLFGYGIERYDLINPISTEKLVDEWFQKFLTKTTESILRNT